MGPKKRRNISKSAKIPAPEVLQENAEDNDAASSVGLAKDTDKDEDMPCGLFTI